MNKKNLIHIPFLIGCIITMSCSSTGELQKCTIRLLDDANWDFQNMTVSELDIAGNVTVHDRYYLTDDDTAELWKQYIKVDPSEQWTGPMVHFNGVYDPAEDRLFTRTDMNIPCFSEGQIMFLDLVVEHLKHFPTSFMITEIDPELSRFAFNYLDINIASGRQEVSFFELEDDAGYKTLIRHRSWFHNESGIRNRLYSTYHEQAIDEYHYRIAEFNDHELKNISIRVVIKRGLVPEDRPL